MKPTPRSSSPAVIEPLEERRLLFASIPAGYTRLETVHIRPVAGNYAAQVTLAKGVNYFFRATGTAITSSGQNHGDAAFLFGSTTTSATWGVSVVVGSTTNAPTAWGTKPQGDDVYGQSITPTASATPTFTFATDGLAAASSIAVSIYAPVPSLTIAKIRTNKPTGSINAATVKDTGVFLPLNNADWDHNGTADNVQTGAVQGDQYLLPITLPAIAGATKKSHYFVQAPKGLHVWLNPDRTGSTVGVGIRATTARTVYVEGVKQQPKLAPVTLKVLVPYGGVTLEQHIPMTVFTFSGPTKATGGGKQAYGSTAPVGKWSSAVGGTLAVKSITHAGETAYVNVTWDNVTQTGYAEYRIDGNYLWAIGVDVTAVT